MRRINILIFLLFVWSVAANAQTVVSPYSSNGLGELSFSGMPQNLGMGEIGISTPTFWHINNVNPALAVFNTLTAFQVGFQGDIRSFTTQNNTQSDGTAGLRFLNISFPVISGKWTSAVAVLPYSTVNYDFFSRQTIDGTDLESINAFAGEGGLSRLDWTNGVAITKNFSIGLKSSFVFGSVRNRLQSIVEGDNSPFTINYNNEIAYQDFAFQFGGFYRVQISETRAVNFGLTYDLSTTLDGTRDELFTRETAGTLIQRQEIRVDQSETFELPTVIGLGISYQILNKWTIGADITRGSGGEYSSNPNFRDDLKIAVGAEFVPDYVNVRSYWNRIFYRAGFTYKELPYIVNDTDLNDIGFTFGATFPINAVSTIDSAFKLGWRGTTDNDLVRENYFQIVLGATINDRWFIKRRYD
ncbi:MAG: hypothetical protein R8G66_27970 [Cytophagales bacterium]|nr:hypothetical protein [Cytophagales bacterium]